MNLAGLAVRHAAERHAVYDGERWLTWGELRARAAATAVGLQELGVQPGDRVPLVWPSSADFVVAYLGVLAAGAVAVPLNPTSPPLELERQLGAVSPKVVLAAAQGADAIGLLATAGSGAGALVLDGGRSVPSWEELSAPSAEARRLQPVERSPADPAVLLFTSGTAGDPRPAILTHGSLLANLRQMGSVPSEQVEPGDVGFAAIPLFHVFGLNVVAGVALAAGLPMVLEERFSAAAAAASIRRFGVTLVVGAPAVFQAWLALPEEEAAADQFSSVRRAVSGAAALPPEVAVAFERRFGVPIWQGYGLTEASPVVSTTVGTGRHLPGSVGRPLPGVEVRLVDEAGDDVLLGDPGEIWVRGANVFAGYWQDPEATSAVLVDGWLRTGDVAVVNDDGDLFIVDRKKDLIIVGGFNVFPAEVERCLAEHPAVAEAVALGVADASGGETVEAVVVTAGGVEVSAEQLITHCRARLARYKCPTRVRFTERLPYNLAGKALRRAVREGR